jgi:hypothetical protein
MAAARGSVNDKVGIQKSILHDDIIVQTSLIMARPTEALIVKRHGR